MLNVYYDMSFFTPPQNSKYLFIDMNSYFASCEQQAHPLYRKKPLVVTPVNTPNGCIISASYEAKKIGIKTGTLVKEAKKIYPEIIICESDTQLYLKFYKKWTAVIRNFSPFVSIKSIDEAVIKLSPSERSSQKAYFLATKIKSAIRKQVGDYIYSSIGIGPNVFLAKQGSDFQKPDGLFEIKQENLHEYYLKISLTDIKGINSKMEKRLKSMGLERPIDLFMSSCEKLKRQMGIIGEYWYLKLHGYDIPESYRLFPKTIGRSHVLAPRYRNWESAWPICQKLAEKIGYHLRSYGLVAEGIYLKIKFLSKKDEIKSWKKYSKIQPFCDSFTFFRILYNFWSKIPKEFLPFKISIYLFDFSKPIYRQRKLFASQEKEENLSFTCDFINDRYGAFTIKPAAIITTKQSVPDRISFGQPLFNRNF